MDVSPRGEAEETGGGPRSSTSSAELVLSRDYADLIAGSLAVVVGLAAACYAAASYSLGSFRQMGPGMVPAILGLLLAAFGLAVLLPAWVRRGSVPNVNLRPFLATVAGMTLFTVLIRYAGLLPASFLMILVVSRADRRLGVFGAVALGALLSVCAVGLFVYGLGFPVDPLGPMLQWK